MPDEELHVVARLQAKSGEEANVRTALEKIVPAARKEDGCLHYELFQEKKAPGTYFTFERWASQAAFDKHMEAVKPALKDAMPLLSEPPDLRVLGASLG
jgi:quinol monooxygenase YgiN